MKTRFAIRITDDGLALLDGGDGEWVEIGSARFDSDDLDADVATLSAKAAARAPDGFGTLLVLPDSQILYTPVTDAGADLPTQRERILTALDGRTPYDVTDLVFDWVMQADGTAQVAVIARETLDEAFAFAAGRGLNPLGFTASPDPSRHPVAPFFGLTALAGPSDTVTAGGAPIVATRIEADIEPEPEPAPDLPETEPEAEPDEPAEPPAPLPEPPPPVPQEIPEPPAEPASDPEPLPVPQPDPPAQPEPEPLPVPEPSPGPDPSPDPVPEPLDVPGFDPMPEPVTMREPARATSVLDPAIADPDEAPMAVDVPLDPEPARPAAQAVAALPVDDIPPAPAAAASLAFASRRDVSASLTGARPVGGAAKPASLPAGKAAPSKPVERPAGLRPPPKLGYAELPDAKGVKETGARALKGLGALVTAPGIAGTRKPKPAAPIGPSMPRPAAAPAPAATASAAPAAQAARAATRPEFRGRPAPARGKPRHLGLILTGALLVLLALAAALSSYFVTEPDPVDAAYLTLPNAPEADQVPAIDDEMLADGQDIPPPRTGAADTLAAAPPVPPPAPEGEAAAAAQAAEPAPVVAAATDASAVRPADAPQDEITLSASDTAPQVLDALALPVPEARGDPPPAALLPPPPFGTVYQFDANGLIRPTPEGIVSPEGVLLVAGRPPLVPPPRPEGLAPAAVAPAPTDAPPAAAAFPADPALADARPRARPAGLAPAAGAAPFPSQDDTTGLVPASATRFVSLRPAARPDAILAAGLQAQQASLAAASLAAPDPNRSVLALSVSRRPAPRPADMARAVEAAVAAAARQPDPEPVPAAAAPPPEEVTPETEEEPELASAAPAIPSHANVAKQATVRNAIDLSDLNLIGIYGTQSDRYALVRQPNGRYVKVRVGDRLDGGRVAAITGSEVRYEKRGRMQVLEMPRG